MTQVNLLTAPVFRGVISAPSGAQYSIAPGQTISVDERDVDTLFRYGCTVAPAGTSTGGGVVLSATVTISSAEILAGLTTPITIVAAPGAGKVIQPVLSFYSLQFGTVAYTNSTGFSGLFYTDKSDQQADAGDHGILLETASGVLNQTPNINTVLPSRWSRQRTYCMASFYGSLY